MFPVTGRFAKPLDEPKLQAIIEKAPLPKPEPEIVLPKAVKKPNLNAQPWYEEINGVRHNTSDAHLINDHHADPKIVKLLTPEEKNRYHGTFHQNQVKAVVRAPAVSPCANGQCNLPQMRRGRRR